MCIEQTLQPLYAVTRSETAYLPGLRGRYWWCCGAPVVFYPERLTIEILIFLNIIILVNTPTRKVETTMTKKEYIQEIESLMKQTDDEVLLEFILKMLRRSLLHKAS